MTDIQWYQKGQSTDWDAAEVETSDGTICPYVARLPGPDTRAMFSIDVPEADGEIRSLAVGFAPDLDTARAAAAEAIEKIDVGLSLVLSTEDDSSAADEER